MDLRTFLEAIARGAVTGLGSGLFALALVMTYRTTRVLNLSLGAVATIAAFTMSTLWGEGSVPGPIALLVVLVLGAAIGGVSEVAVRPLRDASIVAKAVAALGLLLVGQAAVGLIWGPGERFLPLLVEGGVGSGGLRIAHQQTITAIAVLAVAAAVVVWTRATRTGIATLAVAEDADAARLLGLRGSVVSSVVFIVSGAIAALAGVLLSGFTVLNGTEMTLSMVGALAAALLAGFASIPIAVAASAGVGSVTAVAAAVPGFAAVPGAVESAAFVVVIAVVLFLRPRQDVLQRA